MKRIGNCLSRNGLLSLVMLIAMLVPMIAACQEANASGNPAATQPGKILPEIKVFPVGKLNVKYIADILRNEFRSFQVGEDSVGVFGTPSDLQRAAQMIDTLKAALPPAVPVSQETIYVSVIGASLAGQSGKFPAMLTETVKELEPIFPYKGYVLLDTFPVLVDSGTNRFSTSASMLARCAERFNMPCEQTLRLNNVKYEGDAISVELLEYRLQIPLGSKPVKPDIEGKNAPIQTQQPDNSTFPAGVSSGFTLKRNQTLVLGKLSTVGGEDAIFIAVSRLAK